MSEIIGRILAGALIVVGVPVHLVICAVIWLADRGAPLYRACRTGRGGVEFVMFKYRTMRINCVSQVTKDFKTVVQRNDPRVTFLGRFLRAFGIDELPQLLNIVRGDMSWVGPRPDEAWMYQNYGVAIRQRVAVKPGITGLAQVFDGRALSTGRSYAVDLWYVRRRSVWMDLYVLAITPLFLGGFRSIGRPRLRSLLRSAEFAELERICSGELDMVEVGIRGSR